MNKKFQFSCQTFGGFNVSLDVSLVDTKEDIINYCINVLETVLSNNNLWELKIKLQVLKKTPGYDIHNFTYGDIVSNDDEDYIFYLCSHPH